LWALFLFFSLFLIYLLHKDLKLSLLVFLLYDVAINDALRMEINSLKIATGQVVPNSGPAGMMPFGVPHKFALNPQFYSGPRGFNQPPGTHPSLMSAQQLQLNQPSHQRPHQTPPPQIIIQQQQQAMMQQQQASQAQTQAMMQQAQMRMPSPAQAMIRSQPLVMMPPQGQGIMRQHGMMPPSSHHAELQIKGPMVVNKSEIEGNFENFN
jgi:hypothetical protein